MISDEDLYEIYMQGFHDELDVFKPLRIVYSKLAKIAYNLGKDHAIIGDDASSMDDISEIETVQIIRNTYEESIK